MWERAYGLLPDALAEGRLPTGWISLSVEPAPDWDGGDVAGPTCELPDGLDTTFKNMTWPSGVVPFEFDANVSSLNQTRSLNAMVVIQSLANVTFVVRSGETGYLHIQDDTQNQSSTIGFGGGQTTIKMVSWFSQAVIVHEILHALGFFHEQQRPDRDPFIQIFLGNVQAGKSSNFSKVPAAIVAGPYDFGSVMHYGACAFSTCCPVGIGCACAAGCETILPQAAYAAFRSSMGQRVAMSPLDVHGLRSLYSASHWRFVDPDYPFAGTGTGLNPWMLLASALASASSGARVFVMPGTCSAVGVWDTALTLEAPVGGVLAQ